MNSCNSIPKDWNDISIEDVGDIKIPDSWVVSEIDDSIIIADKSIGEVGCDVYAMGIYFNDNDWSTCVFESDLVGKVYAYDGDGAKDVSAFSNSAMYAKKCFSVNGQRKWLDIVQLYNENDEGKSIDYIIVFLEESIDVNMIKTIAESYSRFE